MGRTPALLLALLAACAQARAPDVPTVEVGAVRGHAVLVEEGPSARSRTAGLQGTPVEVEWHGRWWPAILLERRGNDHWLVHYEGYGENWDEVVGPDRIRERQPDPDVSPIDDDDDDPP